MFRNKIPWWITIGGFALALIAGWINGIGFIGLHHQALSHMSGTVTLVAVGFAEKESSAALHSGAILLAFFAGALLSGALIRQSTLRLGRRYGIALCFESLLLFGATSYLLRGLHSGEYLAAMACGLQNAMAASYSGSVIRTTHLTGMITDLGIACGQVCTGTKVEWPRFKLYAVLLCGFAVGSFFGGLAYIHFGYSSLYLPAVIAGGAGAIYTSYAHYMKSQAPSAPS
jgi:uncharacterized membrane protein YoaK (UPF0700 family)